MKKIELKQDLTAQIDETSLIIDDRQKVYDEIATIPIEVIPKLVQFLEENREIWSNEFSKTTR